MDQLIWPLIFTINSTNLNQGLTQFELILNDGEKSKSIDYNIDYLNNSYYYSNLILFGSLCFYTQDNLNVYCPDSYSQIPIQPNGLFSISNNSIIILDNTLCFVHSCKHYFYTNVACGCFGRFGLAANIASPLKLKPKKNSQNSKKW